MRQPCQSFSLISLGVAAVVIGTMACAGCNHKSPSAMGPDGAVDGPSISEGGAPTDGPGPDIAAVSPDGIELANGQKGPESIAVDDQYVYWTNQEDDHVMKIPKDQSGPAVLIHANDFGSVKSIAVDGADVFWGGSLLYKQDKITGEIQTFSSGSFASALSLAGSIYWVADLSSASAIDLQVESLAPGASGTVSVGPSYMNGWFIFAVDQTTIYFGIRSPNDDTGEIDVVTIGGGTPTVFAITRYPWQVVVDDQYVYWLEGRLANGSVMKKSKAGTLDAGNVIALAQDVGINEPQSMVADGDALYWTQLGVGAGGGSVGKVSKTGGDAHFIASNQVIPQGIAVDDQSVYWVNYGPTYNGTVRKIAK